MLEEEGERGGTRGERGRYTHHSERVGIAASRGGKTHAGRRKVRGRGPRGRLKVAAGPHARLCHKHVRNRAYAHGIYTRCCNTGVCTATLTANMRARALQRRLRVAHTAWTCTCGQCARARGYSVVIRHSYGGGIMSSHSCVEKTEEAESLL